MDCVCGGGPVAAPDGRAGDGASGGRQRRRRAASKARSAGRAARRADSFGAYPSRRVSSPSATRLRNRQRRRLLKDAPRSRDASRRYGRRCGRRMKGSCPASWRHARIDGRVPERRSVLPQRLLAVARRDVRPRALPPRREPRAHVQPPGTRQSLLPPALADEREHHGVRPPALRHPRDATAHFALADVPAGEYRLSAWHERIGESAKSIVVEAGRTVRIEFALPVETQ